MPTKSLTEKEMRATVAAVNKAIGKGHTTAARASAAAATALDMQPHQVRHRLARAKAIHGIAPEYPDEVTVSDIPPAEIHDAKFHKRRAATAQRDIERLEHLVRELSGFNVQPGRPRWKPSASGGKGKSVICGLLSDLHDGEVITAGAVHGINEYNPEVCEQRVRRYMTAFCEIGARWASDTDNQGAMLTFNGDLISGDIHEELMRTNALTSLEQVMHCASVVSATVGMALEAYPTVHVVGTPGNHGRTTHKSTAKLYAELSYDSLIMHQVAKEWAGEKRVTFQSGQKDAVTPVLNDLVVSTHGDKIGTGGGQGFAGPMLPVLRGAKKLIEQMNSVGTPPTIIQLSHYHKVGNPYVGSVPIFANGSVVGYSEYAGDIRASVEPAQQWMYLVHSRWGVRETLSVKLEDR